MGQNKRAFEVLDGGLSEASNPVEVREIHTFDPRGEISLPFGMTSQGMRRGIIEFYVDSIKFPKVSVPSGRRFVDAQELLENVARGSVGTSPDKSDGPMPILLAECLEREQSKFIPKRLQGKIILILESLLTDSVGKQHIRTLEYIKNKKVWVRGTMPIYGAAFYPEFFVVARCRIHIKGQQGISNRYVDT